jgi:hypothetical protein
MGGLRGAEGARLTRSVNAGTVGAATVDDAPHGPSHMPFMAAQWSTAIASGTKSPQRAIMATTTATRSPFMAWYFNT